MFFSFLYFLATLYIYICSFTTLKYYFYYMLNSHFFCTVLFTSLCNHTVVINKAFYSMMAFDTVISTHCLLSLFFFVIILCFVLWLLLLISFPRGFTVSNNAFGASLIAQSVESACSARDLGSIPGLGRSPGEGNDNPLQYHCLENLMDRGAW